MSQYSSRIHIRVIDSTVWERFEKNYDAGFELAELAEINQKTFTIFGDWSCNENELYRIVSKLSQIIYEDGIIIADTTNINVDEYTYCIYYLGDGVTRKEFSVGPRRKMYYDVNISDVAKWLSYGKFDIDDIEEEQLYKIGIATISNSKGRSFIEYENALKLPNKIYLRETDLKERIEAIENVDLCEELQLKHIKNNPYNSLLIEVVSSKGSIRIFTIRCRR